MVGIMDSLLEYLAVTKKDEGEGKGVSPIFNVQPKTPSHFHGQE